MTAALLSSLPDVQVLLSRGKAGIVQSMGNSRGFLWVQSLRASYSVQTKISTYYLLNKLHFSSASLI